LKAVQPHHDSTFRRNGFQGRPREQVAEDADLFEPSFKEWVAMAEEALAEMQKSGVFPEKVHINSNDFLAWCLAHDKENNAAARAEFVSEQLRAKSERGA
jgi:hypothetical protein